MASSPHGVLDMCLELLVLYMRLRAPMLHSLESTRSGTLGLLGLSINGIESHQWATLPHCLGQSCRRPWLHNGGIGCCCSPHAYIWGQCGMLVLCANFLGHLAGLPLKLCYGYWSCDMGQCIMEVISWLFLLVGSGFGLISICNWQLRILHFQCIFCWLEMPELCSAQC